MSTVTSAVSGYSQASEIYQFLKDFKQLGKDLRSGDIAAAQEDFVTLSSDVAGLTGTSTTSTASTDAISTTDAISSTDSTSTDSTTASATDSTSTSATDSVSSRLQAKEAKIAEEFQALQKALESGDLDAAKQAYQQIKQTLGQGHHHHFSQDSSTLSQLLNSLFGSSSSTDSTSSSTSSTSSTDSSTSTDASTSTTSADGSSTTGSSSTTDSTAAADSSSSSSSSTSSTSADAASTSDSSSSDLLTKFGKLLETIGKDLESGDISGAKQAFADFADSLKSTQDSSNAQVTGHHHHHHHHHGGSVSASNAYALVQGFIQSQSTSSSSSDASSSSSDSTSSSSLDVTA